MRHLFAHAINRSLYFLQVKEIALVLLLTVSLPIVVHLIPSTGNVPIGAKLLPIFYAPLIAALLFKPQVSIFTALLAPVINHGLTGSPEWNVAIILTFELFVFVLFILGIRHYRLKWVAGPLGYAVAKLFSVLLVFMIPGLLERGSPVGFGISSLRNGIFGVILLTVIGIAALAFAKKRANQNEWNK